MDKQIKKGDIILNQYEAINDSSIKGCIESVDCVDSKAKNKKYLLYRTENIINYQTHIYISITIINLFRMRLKNCIIVQNFLYMKIVCFIYYL